MMMSRLILYSGELSREKTFTNFAVLYLSAKVLSMIVLRFSGQ